MPCPIIWTWLQVQIFKIAEVFPARSAAADKERLAAKDGDKEEFSAVDEAFASLTERKGPKHPAMPWWGKPLSSL